MMNPKTWRDWKNSVKQFRSTGKSSVAQTEISLLRLRRKNRNDRKTWGLGNLLLTNLSKSVIFPSLTVVGRKNRCIPCVYWATAIFAVVLNYSNLFLPFAFFLDCSHFTFGYELVVCPETAGFMKIIRDLFPSIQWNESLLLYSGKIHSFQSI